MGARPTLEAMHATAAAVREMRAAIDAHLSGAMSAEQLRERAEILPYRMSTNDEARACCLDLRRYGLPDEPRREDLVAYARELAEGFALSVDERGSAKISIEDLSARAGTQVVRRGTDGLGLVHTTRFASPATGRTFAAWSTPNTNDVVLCMPRGDRPFAVVDLIESFLWDVVEVPDATRDLELDVLPVVALMREDDNGNRSEIRSFRSYTGAMLEAQRFEELGHKQRYWAEVRREPGW